MTWLERLCEERGLRVTEHRRIVLEVLSRAADHPCAREIHRRAATGHIIGLSTVYRALNSLVDIGIVTRRSIGNQTFYRSVSATPDHSAS